MATHYLSKLVGDVVTCGCDICSSLPDTLEVTLSGIVICGACWFGQQLVLTGINSTHEVTRIAPGANVWEGTAGTFSTTIFENGDCSGTNFGISNGDNYLRVTCAGGLLETFSSYTETIFGVSRILFLSDYTALNDAGNNLNNCTPPEAASGGSAIVSVPTP